MFQTTAERRCELTRVRPSGLNTTSLTGLVSARQRGAVRRAGLRVPHEDRPVERAAASSRPSGLRSSESATSLPTDSGGPTASPLSTSTMDTEPESSLAISVRPPRRRSPPPRPRSRSRAASDPAPRGDLPDPDGPGSARDGDPLRVRAEGDRLRAADLRRVRRRSAAPITRPLAASHRVTWFVSCPPAAMTLPSGLKRTVASAGSSDDAAAGSVSSRRFFLVATSHSSTRPSPPAIASVRPSGLKSTPPSRPATSAGAGRRGSSRRVPERRSTHASRSPAAGRPG